MKRIALVFILFCLTFTSCEKNNNKILTEFSTTKSIFDIVDNSDMDLDINTYREEEQALFSQINNHTGNDRPYMILGYLYLDVHESLNNTADKDIAKKLSEASFDLALKLNSSNSKAYAGRHISEYGTSKADVLTLYEKIIEIDPKMKNLIGPEKKDATLANKYTVLVDVYRGEGTWFSGKRRALELNERVLRQNPDDQRAYINKGQLLMGLGRLEEAKTATIKAVELAHDPNHRFFLHEANNLLGKIYQQLGQIDLAEELLAQATIDEKGEHWACAYQSLGGLYRDIGEPGKAAIMDMKAADIYKDNPDAAFAAALKCFEIGDFDNADKYLKRAAALRNDAQCKLLRGFLLLFENKNEQAKQHFQNLMNDQDAVGGAEVGLGHYYISVKDYGKAQQLLESATQDVGSGGWLVFEMACLGMGWSLANQNQHEKALVYFGKLTGKSPGNTLALLGEGNSLIGLGRLGEARKVFERVLKIQPGNRYALAELGIINVSSGDDKKAEEDFLKALAQDNKKYTCPYEGLGLLYMKQGQIDKAKESFQKAIKINPDIEYKKFNGLAKIYIQEGKLDQARGLLKKSMENFPYDKEAGELLKTIDKMESGAGG